MELWLHTPCTPQIMSDLFLALPGTLQHLTLLLMEAGRSGSIEEVVASQLGRCARRGLTHLTLNLFCSIKPFIGAVPACVQHIDFIYLERTVTQEDAEAFVHSHRHLKSIKFFACPLQWGMQLNRRPNRIITMDACAYK